MEDRLGVQSLSSDVVLGTDLLTNCEGCLNSKAKVFAFRNSSCKLSCYKWKEAFNLKIMINVNRMETNDISSLLVD